MRIPIEEDSVWAFKNKDDVGYYSLGALKHDRQEKDIFIQLSIMVYNMKTNMVGNYQKTLLKK